jgi:hypothetical protein
MFKPRPLIWASTACCRGSFTFVPSLMYYITICLKEPKKAQTSDIGRQIFGPIFKPGDEEVETRFKLLLIRKDSIYITKYNDMKEYGGRYIVPYIYNSVTTWRWAVSFTPRPYYSWGKCSEYQLDGRLGGPQGLSGRDGEDTNCYCWQVSNSRQWSVTLLTKLPGSYSQSFCSLSTPRKFFALTFNTCWHFLIWTCHCHLLHFFVKAHFLEVSNSKCIY